MQRHLKNCGAIDYDIQHEIQQKKIEINTQARFIFHKL